MKSLIREWGVGEREKRGTRNMEGKGEKNRAGIEWWVETEVSDVLVLALSHTFFFFGVGGGMSMAHLTRSHYGTLQHIMAHCNLQFNCSLPVLNGRGIPPSCCDQR